MFGLELTKDTGIKVYKILGDSNLVVMQVKDQFVVEND